MIGFAEPRRPGRICLSVVQRLGDDRLRSVPKTAPRRAYLSYSNGMRLLMPARPRPPLASMANISLMHILPGSTHMIDDRVEQSGIDGRVGADGLVLARAFEFEIVACGRARRLPLSHVATHLSKSSAARP